MPQGRVDYFHETSGYGFIISETVNSDEDVFFHMAEVGDEDPQEGSWVEFSLIPTDKGPRATEFKILEQADNLQQSQRDSEEDECTKRKKAISDINPRKPWKLEAVPEVPETINWEDWERGNRIDQGGTAIIFEAVIDSVDDPIPAAVKTLGRREQTVNSDRHLTLASEAQNWARIDSHDHIVTLYGHGESPAPWILMERMGGGTLVDRVPLEPQYAVSVIEAICSGVDFAHKEGIFHGDIKPANILFSETGREGVPKIGDWGLARVLIDATKSTRGDYTVAYAPPEQIREEEMNAQRRIRRDVYQIGAVAYEAFTGRPPFEGRTEPAVIHSILNTRPEPPSDVCDNIPKSFDKPIMTALAAESEDRQPSVRHFLEELLSKEP